MLFGLVMVEWTTIVACIFAVLTGLWGFCIDIPRIRQHRELIRLGGRRLTHHYFEYPMYFFLGVPTGLTCILFAEYVSVPWAFASVLGISLLVYLIIRIVASRASDWLGIPPEPEATRRTIRILMLFYAWGLLASIILLGL